MTAKYGEVLEHQRAGDLPGDVDAPNADGPTVAEQQARNFDEYVDNAEQARRAAAEANPATRGRRKALALLRYNLKIDNSNRERPTQPDANAVASFIREMDRADERAAAVEGITGRAERRAAREAFDAEFDARGVDEWLPEAQRLLDADAARFERILYASPSIMSQDEAGEAIDALRSGRRLVFQPIDDADTSELSPTVDKDAVKRLRETPQPEPPVYGLSAASGFAPPGAYIGPDGIVPPGHKWGTL